MTVNLINLDEFREFVRDGPVIILFQSTWCRTSVVMALAFDKLAKSYLTKVRFGKVDVDNVKDVINLAAVGAVPECIIYQGSKIEARKFCSPENLDKFLRDTVKIEEDDHEEDY